MYKLKLKKGEKIVIRDRRRSGLNYTLIGGNEYPQHVLENLYENGFKHLITKTKKAVNPEDGE